MVIRVYSIHAVRIPSLASHEKQADAVFAQTDNKGHEKYE